MYIIYPLKWKKLNDAYKKIKLIVFLLAFHHRSNPFFYGNYTYPVSDEGTISCTSFLSDTSVNVHVTAGECLLQSLDFIVKVPLTLYASASQYLRLFLACGCCIKSSTYRNLLSQLFTISSDIVAVSRWISRDYDARKKWFASAGKSYFRNLHKVL